MGKKALLTAILMEKQAVFDKFYKQLSELYDFFLWDRSDIS